MCGIAGVIGEPVETRAVEAMIRAMRHRGPDDQGVWRCDLDGGRRVSMGAARLAVIDLSPAGHMPMVDERTGNVLVYNGEIFNFRDLRREMEAGGERFKSESDTEVVLRAYARWGRACLDRFHGMFAFALWDRMEQELFLARDRLGEKPLYFSEGRVFVFASELRALLASGLRDRRLDPAALEAYLFNGFVVSPLSMIDGVRSLLPGRWMRVGRDGRTIASRRYWALPARHAAEPPASAVDGIRARLEESVRQRLVSDVPLGAFLSGGLDSATQVALMAASTREVRTFSVTFDEAGFDESSFSRWVARRFGTTHTEVRLRCPDFEAWLPDALAALDQPTFDALNTYCVARSAKESGLTVALSGSGADEIFGGYPIFRTIPWLRWARFASRAAPRGLLRTTSAWLQGHPTGVAGVWKVLELLTADRAGAVAGSVSAAYQTSQILYPRWTRRWLLSQDLPDDGRVWFGLPHEFAEALAEECGDDPVVDQISKAALRLFLGERCLRDADSTSMSVSLEVRAPFVDHGFLEAAWTVPGGQRCRGCPNKPFEWEVVRPYLGDDYPRPRKHGFIFPFEAWLRTPAFGARLKQVLLDRELARASGLQPDSVQSLAHSFFEGREKVPWSRVWSIFVLLDWCARHGASV